MWQVDDIAVAGPAIKLEFHEAMLRSHAGTSGNAASSAGRLPWGVVVEEAGRLASSISEHMQARPARRPSAARAPVPGHEEASSSSSSGCSWLPGTCSGSAMGLPSLTRHEASLRCCGVRWCVVCTVHSAWCYSTGARADSAPRLTSLCFAARALLQGSPGALGAEVLELLASKCVDQAEQSMGLLDFANFYGCIAIVLVSHTVDRMLAKKGLVSKLSESVSEMLQQCMVAGAPDDFSRDFFEKKEPQAAPASRPARARPSAEAPAKQQPARGPSRASAAPAAKEASCEDDRSALPARGTATPGPVDPPPPVSDSCQFPCACSAFIGVRGELGSKGGFGARADLAAHTAPPRCNTGPCTVL